MLFFMSLINSKAKIYAWIIGFILLFTAILFSFQYFSSKESSNNAKKVGELTEVVKTIADTNKNNSKVEQNKEEVNKIVNNGINDNINIINNKNDIKDKLNNIHKESLNKVNIINNNKVNNDIKDLNIINNTIIDIPIKDIITSPKEISTVSKDILKYEKSVTDPIIDQLEDL